MRFISCHIENFGKLHDLRIDFQNGANVICEKNGWGKSTFAAFIRVMFYGFDGERKRGIEENERKRYMPWQGGVYGGSLTFEIEGKEYEITRIFKDKEVNDEFEIRDVRTNLQSNDYTSDIGKEIFKIDRDSFMRTMFIGQCNIDTNQTDDINAKIGNLSDNTNDINNYETANDRLSDILNSLTPRRSTGSLSKRRAKITELDNQISTGVAIKDSLDRLGTMVAEEQKKLDEYIGQVNEVRSEIKKVTYMQEVLAKRDEWNKTKQKVAQKKTALENVKTYFTSNIPPRDEIKNQIAEFANYNRHFEKANSNALSDTEQQRFDQLKSRFAAELPDDYALSNMITKASRHSDAQKKLMEKQLAGMRESTVNQKTSLISPLAIVGIVLMIIGVALIFAVSPIVGLIGVVVGAVLMVIGLVTRKKANKDIKDEAEAKERDILTEKAIIDGLANEITAFLNRYGYAADDSRFAEKLYELKNEAGQFVLFEEKIKSYNEADRCARIAVDNIGAFLEKYGFEKRADLNAQLEEIRDKVDEYNYAYGELKEAEDDLKAFEKSVNLELLNGSNLNEGLPSLEELHNREESILDKQEASRETISKYNQQLEQFQEKSDEIEDMRSQLDELKDIQKSEQQFFEYITIAQKKLAEAKEAITSRYSKPILDGFRKYHDMIDMSGDTFRVDANMNITVEEAGKQREVLTQSQGLKDLMAISMRIALVDAMYTDEKPVLIFDDPFTNLDDEKSAKAMLFLKELSKVYQIIYFTCNSVRSK